ncbi:MAG: hypothetical protein BGO72_21430 [Burkholderiales bacterium 70-64]|nr:MAG: hypothetical protein BGO72_21430 [Burkholderiales bacterium 70-64]
MGTPIKSQKTELYWASGPTATSRVVAAASINGLGGPADQIPTTTLDNDTDHTFLGGLGNPGAVTVAFNVHAGEIAHEAVLALKDSKDVVSWGIYGPGSPVPTAVGSVMQPSVTRPSMIFQGYVSDINVDIGENNVWKGSITIQRSGGLTIDLLAP